MIWVNFLHLYQPANADPETVEEATEKSYLRLVSALESHPHIKMTFNISGCLVARWRVLGHDDLIKRIAALVKSGQLELTGTVAYHPIIPLIPEEEVERQIKENEDIITNAFGLQKKPAGFFFPEMAYSPGAGKLIKRLGYEWVILDEILASSKVDSSRTYIDKKNGLKVIFRSRRYSHSYVPDTIWKLLAKGDDQIIVSATDGELYGLRHNDPGGSFEELLADDRLKTLTVSELAVRTDKPERMDVLAGSWESTTSQLKASRPFELWQNPDNKIHALMWELANLAIKTTNKHKDDDNYYWARWHLVRGLASCSFWWASEKDFAHIYGPKAWNPDEIERGTVELIRSIRALEDEITRRVKVKAEELYIEIKRLIWQRHWKHHWKNGD